MGAASDELPTHDIRCAPRGSTGAAEEGLRCDPPVVARCMIVYGCHELRDASAIVSMPRGTRPGSGTGCGCTP